jgi:hypothetical protein
MVEHNTSVALEQWMADAVIGRFCQPNWPLTTRDHRYGFGVALPACGALPVADASAVE